MLIYKSHGFKWTHVTAEKSMCYKQAALLKRHFRSLALSKLMNIGRHNSLSAKDLHGVHLLSLRFPCRAS